MAAAPHAPAAFAALLGALATAEAGAVLATRPGASSVDWSFVVVVVLVSLATTVPLGFLWAQPAAAAAAVSAACVLSLAAFRTLTVAGLLAELTVLYRLGRHGSQLLAAGLALPFLVLALATPALAQARIPAVLLAALGPSAAWAGAAHRSRSEAVEHSAARQAIAGTLLEHTARGERARISRELHDVVAHHISMIAVQAETARLTTPGMPAAGAQRLASIGDTARAALTEMRRLLGVLRPGVELAAYRIVQEALTNARRHAPGAAVDVELRYAPDALWLRIRDNGPGPPPAPATGGHGLLGMRERAAAVGGELRTGAAAGGGFLVEAVLPATAEAAA